MGDNGGIETFHVIALVHHMAPPAGFDVVFEFDPQRTVIVNAFEASVDFGGLEDEPTAFAEGDDVVHIGGGHGGGFLFGLEVF